jgi:hypothetical protein
LLKDAETLLKDAGKINKSTDKFWLGYSAIAIPNPWNSLINV